MCYLKLIHTQINIPYFIRYPYISSLFFFFSKKKGQIIFSEIHLNSPLFIKFALEISKFVKSLHRPPLLMLAH